MRTHNTFLDFSERSTVLERAGKLRRASSDPCILSPASSVESEAGLPPDIPQMVKPVKVFVGSLPSHVDEPFLFNYMSHFGAVKSVVVKRNSNTGISRRYGYVRFHDPPNEDIFLRLWLIGEKVIRIKAYERNPCWKNKHFSEEDTADEVWV